MIRVNITYHMSKGQWDSAENCIETSIEKYRYEHIAEELRDCCNGISTTVAAGKWVTEMLTALVKLQGYTRVDSWQISAADMEK